LRLKLRSCDDLDHVRFSLAGVTGAHPPHLAELTLPYTAELAAIKFLHHIEVKIMAYCRRFAVLSVEPAQTCTDVLVLREIRLPSEESAGDFDLTADELRLPLARMDNAFAFPATCTY